MCSSGPHESLAVLSAEDWAAVAMRCEINPATKSSFLSCRRAVTRLVSARGEADVGFRLILPCAPCFARFSWASAYRHKETQSQSHVGSRETSRRRCDCQSVFLLPKTRGAFLSGGGSPSDQNKQLFPALLDLGPLSMNFNVESPISPGHIVSFFSALTERLFCMEEAPVTED
jgi:hypothetical protein